MELPFVTDYAKSSRSICRGCQQAVVKNALRVAIMLQSTSFDGKVPNWYHFTCFFIEHMPKSTSDISGYELLKWDDQKQIKNIIESGESPFNEETAKILNNEAARKAEVENFAIGYSKTSQCPCHICNEKISKDEIQIIQRGKKGKANRIHFQCFVKNRRKLGFLEFGNSLSGYDTLKTEDQEVVNQQLANLNETVSGLNNLTSEDKEIVEKQLSEPVPTKKQRLSEEIIILSDEDDDDTKCDIDLMHEYRSNLNSELTKAQVELLLKYNNQRIPSGYENILDRASEMMTYGALSKCPSCRYGQLVPTSSGYKCTGQRAWSKCTAITQNPIRNPVRIPEELKVLFQFLMIYEFEPRQKMIKTANIVVNQPLNYLNFSILGYAPEQETKLKQQIIKLGGRVVSHIKRSVLALVTTREELDRRGTLILKAEECQVYVVSRDFIAAIINVTDQDTVHEIIKKYDMSQWGAEINNRVPQNFIKNVSKPKRKNLEDEESRRKVTVKNGVAIEPDADLDSEAHVYQIGNDRYTAVLCRTDIGTNKNTYYKLQLLEADDLTKYWIYRGWGRTGTDYGSFKLQEISNLKEAIKEFKSQFLKKTGNSWSSRRCFTKKRGLFSYVEVDYEATKEEIENLEVHVAGSKLQPAVAHLIAFIFNVNSMQKLLLEYSLDTQKMPLGKLSKYQIKQAYAVLQEAVTQLPHKDQNQTRILQCSNKFYSFMPYNSALKAPPLLDNMEIIKKKLEMLESLYEMETAYCMIQRNVVGDEGNPLDSYYKQLSTDIEILDQTAEEYPIIVQYVTNTHADTHSSYNLQIIDIFKVNRHEEPERFNKYNTLHNRKLLWHGSRTTNFAGILSQGLRIAPAEAPVSGYMFGKGVYFADMVSKSANYCCIVPGSSENEGLLLLCEVALGNMNEKLCASDVRKLPPNVHSVKGVGKTEPDSNCDVILSDGVCVPVGNPVTNFNINGSLMYNEYIVYDIAQVKLRYLLKVKFSYRHHRY